MIEAAPTHSKPFVRITEAAEELGISEDTLMRAIRPGLVSGEIVNYKIGRIRPISWQSLLAYLDKYYSGVFQKRGRT